MYIVRTVAGCCERSLLINSPLGRNYLFPPSPLLYLLYFSCRVFIFVVHYEPSNIVKCLGENANEFFIGRGVGVGDILVHVYSDNTLSRPGVMATRSGVLKS